MGHTRLILILTWLNCKHTRRKKHSFPPELGPKLLRTKNFVNNVMHDRNADKQWESEAAFCAQQQQNTVVYLYLIDNKLVGCSGISFYCFMSCIFFFTVSCVG